MEDDKTLEFVNSYRLQLTPTFTFNDAIEIIPYLQSLGIDTLYLSPILEAVKGSTHGYDVTDPKTIRRDFGGEEGFKALSRKCKEYGLKIIVDLVANHMATSEANPYWHHVLENGRFSEFSGYFDIRWTCHLKKLKDKLLLPVLEETYSEAIENLLFTLEFSKRGLFLNYKDQMFPLNPLTIEYIVKLRTPVTDCESLAPLLALAEKFAELEQVQSKKECSKKLKKYKSEFLSLLEKEDLRVFLLENLAIINSNESGELEKVLNLQCYRFEFWQMATINVNYRRFFDINSLVGINIENEELFRNFHELTINLIAEGYIDGLRIDHPDGFCDPYTYFCRIQDMLQKQTGCSKRKVPVFVEKILQEGENLRSQWAIDGSVGYEYLNLINKVFVDASTESELSRIYSDYILKKVIPEELLYEKKKSFALANMASEINCLSYLTYQRLQNVESLPFNKEVFKNAIVEFLASFPVYRSYVSDDILDDDDKLILIAAYTKALHLNPHLKQPLDLIKSFFTAETKDLEFVQKFQQLSPVVMAKGYEDTFLYCFNRLISLNEVGSNCLHLGVKEGAFFDAFKHKVESYPLGFLTSTTHDAKRSEEVRQRINMISELPHEWERAVFLWKKLNTKHKVQGSSEDIPGLNFEYFIYQTLVGIWPEEVKANKLDKSLKTRLKEYFLKAAREGKEHTNWIDNNLEFEKALITFVDRILSSENKAFIDSMSQFVSKVDLFSKQKVLASLILKAGLPGIFDVYQGTECWDYSLVDPDNRKEVNFAKREKLLARSDRFSSRLLDKDKFFVLKTLLLFRKKYKNLLFSGEVDSFGFSEVSDEFFGYGRRDKSDKIIILVRRLFVKKGVSNFMLELPKEYQNSNYKDIFTGIELTIEKSLSTKEVFCQNPFCLLVSIS